MRIVSRTRASAIRQNYPYFDEKEGKVVTLELALNQCREANGEAPLSYVKDEMAALTAYMAFTSRGKPFDIKIPNDPRALEAYQNGKHYFYTRRGQLNFSCASCHVQSPGERIRAEVLAPALGILNAMPIYRSEWGGMGTISRRFTSCNSQIRGVPLEPQADEYRDLEYYLSYVSNGSAYLRSRSAAMSMIGKTDMLKCLGIAVLIAATPAAFAASSEADFKAAYAAAEAANQEAGSLRNQWTTTTAALAAAKKAAAAGNFDRRWRPRRPPKRWPRLPFSRPRAKKKPGKRSKYASAILDGAEGSYGHPSPRLSQPCGYCRGLARTDADRAQRRERRRL